MKGSALVGLAALWGTAVGAGNLLVWRYKSTPGAAANAPRHWPEVTSLTPPEGRARLVLFAHPRCPCTRATLGELRTILSRDGARAAATVVFVKPPGAGDDWDDTSIRSLAASIPGVTILTDVDGIEARRFGAKVSGQVMVYGADGALGFSGGITGSRGHEGDNLGRERVLAFLETGRADAPTFKVFGCELLDD